MNTLVLKKEQVFCPKQILLTLKKEPGRCGMSAAIAPIGKNRAVKIKNRKLIKISTKDVNDLFLGRMKNLERFNTGYHMLPKVKQVPDTKKRQSFLNTKRCSILKNSLVGYKSSEFRQNFSHILYKEQTTDDKNKTATLETDPGDLRSKESASSLNKHDRFVPNILRSTKMAENNFNNNSLIRFDQTLGVGTHGGEEQCKDNKNVKRKRKQVLGSLSVKKSEPDKSLPEKLDHNSAEGSGSKNAGIVEIKSEQEESKECPEIKAEGSVTAEESLIDFCPSNDLYIADVDVSYHNSTHNLPCKEEAEIDSGIDKSIKKILAEFEVADYQNYIDCKDLGFEIDEMDKLLSFDTECSLTESSTLDRGAKIEYDVNGNDIDNHGNALQEPIDGDEQEQSIRCKIEPCYDDRSEPLIVNSGRLKSDFNLDALCAGAWGDSGSYTSSKMNLWSTEFEDYYSSNYFQDFRSFDQDSCSTETASESELDSPRSLDLVLPKIGNLGCFETPLVVGDMVPDNVFSSDLRELPSDSLESDDYRAERSVDSSPTMQQYHRNSHDVSDNNYCTSSPGIQLGKFTSNLQFDDRSDLSIELFEDGNFLVDDMLDIKCTFSKEDETCESILANSNAKFEDEKFSEMLKAIPDFDIENADDIEISKLLRLGNNHSSYPPSAPIYSPENELSMDMASKQSNTENIPVWNDDNSQFGSMKFENPAQAEAENTFNGSKHSNMSESLKFSLENEVETGDKDSELAVPALENVSSITEELLLPFNTEVKDIDGSNSSSLLSLPSLIEESNMDELKTLESGSLLPRIHTFGDYSSSDYLSSLSRDVTDSESGNNEDCLLQVVEHSEASHSQVTGHMNIEDTLYSYARQEKNVASQAIVIDLDDEYSVADRRNHCLSELDSSGNLDSYNYQSISYSVSSRRAASSKKLPANLSELKSRGLWTALVKLSKTVRQNISYFRCDFCEKKYRSEEALNDHIDVTHRYRLSRFRYRHKKYVCDKCSKEYCIAGAIERHFKLHENYTLTCRICEKHFSEKVFLRRHVHSFHLDWNLQCNYCGRKFPRKNTLTHHHKRCHGLHNSINYATDN